MRVEAAPIPLVNIVRSEEQAAILRDIGARLIVDSTSPDFPAELEEAIGRAGATLAFDAVGGGKLASSILHAMESAASRQESVYSRYGSSTWKQVYIYGSLDIGPTIIDRRFGLSWGVSGFLLGPFIERIGDEGAAELKERVVRELETTFASRYTDVLSVQDALVPETVARYAQRSTGSKHLIDPSR